MDEAGRGRGSGSLPACQKKQDSQLVDDNSSFHVRQTFCWISSLSHNNFEGCKGMHAACAQSVTTRFAVACASVQEDWMCEGEYSVKRVKSSDQIIPSYLQLLSTT